LLGAAASTYELLHQSNVKAQLNGSGSGGIMTQCRSRSFITAALATVLFAVSSCNGPAQRPGAAEGQGQQSGEAAPANAAAPTNAAVLPNRQEGDFIIHNYRFRSGETLPEVRLHFTTAGTAVRDASGKIRNGVLIMHGSSGNSSQVLADSPLMPPSYSSFFRTSWA
jgi:hypothetical protein